MNALAEWGANYTVTHLVVQPRFSKDNEPIGHTQRYEKEFIMRTGSLSIETKSHTTDHQQAGK
jgi:hypothetical protein